MGHILMYQFLLEVIYFFIEIFINSNLIIFEVKLKFTSNDENLIYKIMTQRNKNSIRIWGHHMKQAT